MVVTPGNIFTNTNVTIEERGAGGVLLARHRRHNGVPFVGLDHIADVLQGVKIAPYYIATGTSLNDTHFWDTTLTDEVFRIECHTRKVIDNKAIFMATMNSNDIPNFAAHPLCNFGLFAGCGWDDDGEPSAGGVLIACVKSPPISDSVELVTIFIVWEIPLYAE